MRKWRMLLLLVVVGAGVGLVSVGKRAIPQYDEMIRLRENCQREWAQVDVLLHRRYDLIPRLVDAVKGYDTHETSTLVAAADAWTGYGRATTLQDKLDASYRTEQNLRSFAAFGQIHPDLKANTLFIQLMAALRDTEDQIAHQRMAYNAAASALNTQVNSFYGRFVAWAGRIQPAPYYQPPASVRAPPSGTFTQDTVPTADAAPAGNTVTAGFHAGDLILKGTLTSGATRRAVLETPDGRQLIVSTGMEIREAKAKVLSIADQQVTLLETVTTHDGKTNTREIEIRE